MPLYRKGGAVILGASLIRIKREYKKSLVIHISHILRYKVAINI